MHLGSTTVPRALANTRKRTSRPNHSPGRNVSRSSPLASGNRVSAIQGEMGCPVSPLRTEASPMAMSSTNLLSMTVGACAPTSRSPDKVRPSYRASLKARRGGAANTGRGCSLMQPLPRTAIRNAWTQSLYMLLDLAIISLPLMSRHAWIVHLAWFQGLVVMPETTGVSELVDQRLPLALSRSARVLELSCAPEDTSMRLLTRAHL